MWDKGEAKDELRDLGPNDCQEICRYRDESFPQVAGASGKEPKPVQET